MIINANTTSLDNGNMCSNPASMICTCGGVEMAGQRQMLKRVRQAYRAEGVDTSIIDESSFVIGNNSRMQEA